jgi:radical SAM superfamily enzyme YgiQ (UPF0313 family)/uncharacterized protein (DUF2344 family)
LNLINPLIDIGSELNSVQSPSRYTGGEYGITIKKHIGKEDYFNFAIAFPDLYEIGMSNQAIKILYNGLNKFDDIRCERVFTVENDFEQLLNKKNIPLYTLETGMPLNQVDMIGFSIGYELGINGVLSCLELGRVPLLAKDRSEGDPIIIAGGCGVTNPAPISDFFDAIFIGEAEDTFFELIENLSKLKRDGASRKSILEVLDSHPSVWTRTETSKIAKRAVQEDFGLVPSVPSWFPLANVRPVQDHGVVEIMRGCPNGCRFCHAGIYYRPQRIKNKKLIINETDHIVFDAGCREISLNSLSSADYPDIENLLDTLNERYKGYNVSFQLPSLKVNSMSLPILEKLSTVRKSGLTFAVETPDEAWQLSLNKEVYAQHLVDIMLEAKARGWGTAKFYFMIGLPVGDYFGKENNPTGKSEEETIVEFLIDLQAKTKMQCNVNVGIFIPKPHTPYQWVKQITPEKAKEKLDYIFTHLPRGKFKLSKHNYDTTILEGLISRGDERVGALIYNAYKKGARLDAWEEHLEVNMKYWNEAFNEADWDVLGTVYKEWNLDEKLPWDSVCLGPSKNYYKKEWQRSIEHTLTPKCENNCMHPCGVCNKKENTEVHSVSEIESLSSSIKNNTVVTPQVYPESNIQVMYRVIFSFQRKNGSEYVAYLSQVEIFHKAFLRSSLPVLFTNGFNPLPRIEFATAMTLGIPSDEEIASCVMYSPMDKTEFIKSMNKALPANIQIQNAFIFAVTNQRKRESLCEGLWGSSYRFIFKDDINVNLLLQNKDIDLYPQNGETDEYNSISYSKDKSGAINFMIPFSKDKPFRNEIELLFNKKLYQIADITKTGTFAKPKITGWTEDDEVVWRTTGICETKAEDTKLIATENKAISYFALYTKLAAINKSLIDNRLQFNKERDLFYAEHPDVLLKRQANLKK